MSSEVISQPGAQLTRAVLGEEGGTWQPPNALLSATGRALPFVSSLCNMYMGLLRAHLAAEKLHHKFSSEQIFTSLTNPST